MNKYAKHWEVVSFHFSTQNERDLIRDDLKYLRANITFNDDNLYKFYEIDLDEDNKLIICKDHYSILHDFIDKINLTNDNQYQSTRYLIGLVNKFITSIILFNTKNPESDGLLLILPSKELVFDFDSINFTNYVYFIFALLTECNNTVFSKPFILALPVRFKNKHCSFIYYKNTHDGQIEK